jgi:hypothetical protein
MGVTLFNRDSYAPPAGMPLFVPPAGRGIWTMAHERSLFVFLVFFFCFVTIFKGFLVLVFY